ncbi:hypothetical protein CAPTEDRAFT_185170 [Capitella teleta]|uniref:Uncharacterized protein n=1 Tax=Capitella teleta TaxID=283909 RepID=R7UTV2_CAPTE|nr:hypothetical protein CAPTEDRAFT_185170 [Capitella teleta]|eukprot:ELU09959.1 hypothetical protein CAPTEDRAFT_185170 [Capitella teleta]
MASAQTGEQFFVFLREDGVLCEDVEIKIEVTHDVCQTVDNGEALGPLFVKIDENPVPVTVIKQKAVGFSRDQTLFLLSQMSAKVDILFDGGKARSMAELRDRMSARRGGMKKFWLDVASTLSKAFSLIFDAEKPCVWVHRPLEMEMEMDSDVPVPVPVPEEVADKAEASPARKKKTKKTDRFAKMLAHMKTTDEAMLQILRTSTETFERIGNSLVSALNAGRASNN